MRTEHLGKRPLIDPTALIAPTAIVSGDVHVGAGSVILAGAIVTSQGAPVRIGRSCIVMEHAVLRGAGRYPCTLGNFYPPDEAPAVHAQLRAVGFTRAVFGFES